MRRSVNHMSEVLRNPIVGTVVGGLILSFLVWLVRILFPPLWGWIKDIAIVLVGFFTTGITLPIWLVCGLSFGWVLLIVTRRSRPKSRHPAMPTQDLHGPATEAQKPVEVWPPVLNEFERKIIAILASEDGERLTSKQLASQISTSNLRVEQALESLMSKGLVDRSRNYAYGDFYFLSPSGRDLAIQLEFA